MQLTLEMVPLGGLRLRDGSVLGALDGVLSALHAARSDFRVIAYSIQAKQIHLVVEADGAPAFSSGVRALCIRIGRQINIALHRSGRLFFERHYRRVLTIPRDARKGLAFVLVNRARHVGPQRRRGPAIDTVDPYGSGES